MSDDGQIAGSHSSKPISLRIVLLDAGLSVPAYAHDGDAGLDLVARTDVTISAATGPSLVQTGITVEIPEGHVGLICPRSGLASHHGISVLNAPGVVDSGYRGEVGVVLFSVLERAHIVRRGDRIAQLLVQPVARCNIELVASLEETPRGRAGFGSTGISSARSSSG